MNKTIMHAVYGVIMLDENIWTGKKNLAINGKLLPKRKKNVYLLGEGETAIPVTLKGSTLTGASVIIGGEEITIIPNPSTLDWLLSSLPFVLMLIWGNSVALCSIIPVIGGGIGGAIGGLGIVLCMTNIREKPLGKKLLVSLLTLLGTFAVGAVLGYLFLGVLIAGSM